MKRHIPIVVILLIFSTSFVGISYNIEKSSVFSYEDDIFYVGGSGYGNYTNIQDAIDNASNGDTVFVFNDSSPYFENIIIDVSINLIGEDKESTVIDGNMSGDGIYISADWVNISGFTIRNTGEWFFDYGIEIRSNHCIIESSNIVSNENHGIYVRDSTNNIISNNYFSQNYYCILLWGSNHNTILDNNIENCHSGIGVNSHSSYNNISQNIIENVEENSIYFAANCDNNIATNNTLSNSAYGICAYPSSDNDYLDNVINNCDKGIYLTGCTRSYVYGNHISFCDSYGISSTLSAYDTISGNFISNSGQGIYLSMYSNNYTIIDNLITLGSGHGIYLEDSTPDNLFYTVSNNTINHNDGHGIYFKNSCRYNISYNTISYNGGHGIFLNGSSNNNTIIYNTVNSNNGYGIRLENDINSYGRNIIYRNNFITNIFGGYDDCGNNTWNRAYPLEGNYWSDYNGTDDYRGPNQTIPGCDGIGDIPNYLDGECNMDRFPLIYLWGEQRPVANFTYSESLGGYVFNGLSSYDRDGAVVFYHWDFGDGSTGQDEIDGHGYNESGTYDVTLTVTDDDGFVGFYTRRIDAEKNYPPSPPSIDGPTNGKVGKSHTYKFTSEDQELADVSFYIDWGDGKVTPWSDFFASDETYSTNHGWTKGTYTIQAKAKDIYGAESDWSYLEVTMPHTYSSLWWLDGLLARFPLLMRLLEKLII